MTRAALENMTMDTFPVNKQNRAEYNMCREMLADPEAFRLVFFHLPPGESTHLTYAVLNRWKDRVSLLYVPVSAFTDDLVSAIEKGRSPFTMSEYVEPEVLIVDHLQLIAGLEATQEAFCRTVQQRHERGKLTILFSQLSMEQIGPVMHKALTRIIRLHNAT